MKNILLPTDFSDNALNAIRYAVQLYQGQQVTFYLLNTFTPASYHMSYLIENPMPYGMEDVALMNSKRQLEETEETIKKEFDCSTFTFIRLTAFNILVDEIRHVVATYTIDLIIMGTKGATGAKEIFIGTHTMFTIKKTNCPVLAVPNDYKYEDPKDILFPTDYEFSEENTGLSLIRDICALHNSKLNILNAYYGIPLNEQQIAAKNYLDTYLQDTAHLFHLADGMDVLEAVEDFQKKYKINLLVMIRYEHSFLENLFFKPVIKDVVFHTNIPFLVLPSIETK
ncbi:universal stress protein [Aquimarina brevivitae]|uniref:Nucleotide-binding universal stress UspA family protein n=1 Tax=Aquimarina brevivitae TaxID=323412 RepID=A0A4Q7PHQ4_9FLAO|nr:universal stress protein [Aquimarina brevivitae]RZS99697.1 nucleotide-binding universal stress UspA family protein [Aquimarina brevivitae]